MTSPESTQRYPNIFQTGSDVMSDRVSVERVRLVKISIQKIGSVQRFKVQCGFLDVLAGDQNYTPQLELRGSSSVSVTNIGLNLYRFLVITVLSSLVT